MKLSIILVSIFTTFSACSQSYELTQKYNVEKEYTYFVKKAKFKSDEPLAKELFAVTEIKAKFEKFDNNIKCTWVYGETKPEGPKELISQIGAEWHDLINIYKGSIVEFLISSKGDYIKLLNYEDLKLQLLEMFKKMYSDKNLSTDSASFEPIMEMIKPTYETEELLLGTYFNSIPLYYSMTGNTIENEMTQYFSYPFPLTGKDIPFLSVYEIIEDENDILVFKNNGIANSEILNKTFKEFILKMSAKNNEEVNESEIPNISFTNETTFYYDKKNKIMKKVKMKKVIEYFNNSETEIIEVYLKEE